MSRKNSVEACHCIEMYGDTSYFIALIMVEMLNAVLASIKIAKLGYTSLIGHYLLVYKNYGAALVPNDMSGGAGGWLVD